MSYVKILNDGVLLILVYQRALENDSFFVFLFPLNINSCLHAFCLLLLSFLLAVFLFVTYAFENMQFVLLTFPLYCSPPCGIYLKL